MDRPDLTVSTLMDNSIHLKRVKDPTSTCFIHEFINAHVNVSKVRYSMGYFDSETQMKCRFSESALFSMQRKKYNSFGK